MTPREIAAAVTTGASRFVDLCVAGKVTRRSVWIGMQGAAKYARAIAAGDEADSDTRAARLAVCAACTARTPDAAIPEAAGWCGTPLMAEVRDDGPTCGCLLEAKASVGSEMCPRGNWPAQPPTRPTLANNLRNPRQNAVDLGGEHPKM